MLMNRKLECCWRSIANLQQDWKTIKGSIYMWWHPIYQVQWWTNLHKMSWIGKMVSNQPKNYWKKLYIWISWKSHSSRRDKCNSKHLILGEGNILHSRFSWCNIVEMRSRMQLEKPNINDIATTKNLQAAKILSALSEVLRTCQMSLS